MRLLTGRIVLNNWVTGRSVLKDTNVWRNDFARMASNRGILYAFQSLAGVYIYDYLPHKPIRQLVNERYAIAVESFNELLNAPKTGRCCQVIVTMAIILSMHDVCMMSFATCILLAVLQYNFC